MTFALLGLLVLSSIFYIRGYHLIFDWGAAYDKLSFKSVQNGQSLGVFAMMLSASKTPALRCWLEGEL